MDERKLQLDNILGGFMESIHGEFTTLKSVFTRRVGALESSLYVKLISLVELQGYCTFVTLCVGIQSEDG